MKPPLPSLGFRGVVVVAGALLLVSTWECVPRQTGGAWAEGLPESGVNFSSVEIALSNDDEARLEGARKLQRLYRFKDQRLAVTLVDGSRNRNAVHDPTYCIRGGGWKIRSESPIELPKGSAMGVVAERGAEQAHLLYWFSDGESSYPSVVRYWFDSTLRRITFGNRGVEPVLVLVHAAAVSGGPPDWWAIARDFLPQLGL